MYKKAIVILLISSALFTACKGKKEADCVAPAIGQNIVGTWRADLGLGADRESGLVTFKSNGDLVDQGDIFYIYPDTGNNGPVTRYWKIEDGQVRIAQSRTTDPNFRFDVVENDCEKIALDDGFGPFILTDRK